MTIEEKDEYTASVMPDLIRHPENKSPFFKGRERGIQ